MHENAVTIFYYIGSYGNYTFQSGNYDGNYDGNYNGNYDNNNYATAATSTGQRRHTDIRHAVSLLVIVLNLGNHLNVIVARSKRAHDKSSPVLIPPLCPSCSLKVKEGIVSVLENLHI